MTRTDQTILPDRDADIIQGQAYSLSTILTKKSRRIDGGVSSRLVIGSPFNASNSVQ